ncbi:MAG: HAD-IC family P-type ATPase [Patescibacteria group bacterium]|nr:HAD-IC family P-type ATPase [Patescibacteria group bacterium]
MNSNQFDGLSTKEVEERKKQFGKNTLKEKKGASVFIVFLRQFKSPLIFVLLFACIISLIFRHFSEFWVILTVIVINSIMGAYQEYSAEHTLTTLKKFLKPKALVIRDNKRIEIEASELVPGDIVILAAGDQIPADGKAIQANNLIVSEAILTGEEEPVEKEKSEKTNLFMGTTVAAGIGVMEVTDIGQKTEIGKISKGLAEIKDEATPLQQRLNLFSRNLIFVVIIIAIVIFILGITQQKETWTMLELSLVLAVAAIPEGIPIASTVIMALGMRRILKRKGLVKNLLSVETLGSTSVICTDKTGTLTQGIMQVVKTDFKDIKNSNLAMVLANQQKDSLEVSIWKYVNDNSVTSAEELVSESEKIFEEPFDSEKKYSLTVIKNNNKEAGYILGAPEIVLDFCSEKNKEIILKSVNSWAREGLKVVGAAYKIKGDPRSMKDWQWLGLVGIDDPIRPEVKETIIACQNAGIKIKIVTGDYRETAEEVARKLGFEFSSENVMDNKELENISAKELEKKIEDIQIFARVTPHQKLKIIEALQNKKEVVAMTGDGVNDALALKKADIAIAVSNATDVAKEVSDLILIDNNFKTIYAACEEGRVILSNIKKAIGYALSDSFVEMIVILTAVILNFPVPITVVMILWINLICDGPNDILLGFEGKEEGIMSIKPKEIQKITIFDQLMLSVTVVISATVGLASLAFFWYIQKIGGSVELARTAVFASIAFASLVYVFTFKDLKRPLIEIKNFFANKYLFLGVASGFILIILAIYLPFFNQVLSTSPLSLGHWAIVLAISTLSLLLVEILKYFDKHK